MPSRITLTASMMSATPNYREEIGKIIGGQLEGISEEEVLELIEIPQDSNMGDYAFPCFRLAKIMKKSPSKIGRASCRERV